MIVVDVPVEELKPTDYNPRDCTTEEFEAIKQSIQGFQFVEPIVVNEAPNRKNVIIGGHQRLKVAKELRLATIPCVYVNIPDIQKEKELNLRLNKNLGHWDWDKLFANFEHDMLLGVGFTEDEMKYNRDMWDSDLEKVNKDIETGMGIITVIKVLCPQAMKDQVTKDIKEFVMRYDGVKVE